MTEIEKIIELARENKGEIYERSADLVALYMDSDNQKRELIDLVLVILGARPMPKIWEAVNGEEQ
ncbi:hypothetical protein GZ77_21250 [Endozoicomonas montiporae]|uniref:Uncharacterized protein n=3 Tax=Endozoicomonas montiporae TaxID=1027273 RepID=A0A081N3D5_9GAMM|nr:hypothetical protein [Endozoicomonas montiporae]AMO58258.1 hypothetical protein EZMO1_4341 [Endozoicomonas montiporae CL-33]KEQ12958.1 hypothetical protein GZ77_21250 [Endozoicomonas montiporae]